jgi:hypothetical protein
VKLAGFTGFLENRRVKFEKFKKNEIKNSKKLESISRYLIKIEFKNSKEHILQNLSKFKMLKNGKKRKSRRFSQKPLGFAPSPPRFNTIHVPSSCLRLP